MRFCPKCQAETERHASGKCKPCRKAITAAWQAANPERDKANHAAYRAANRAVANATSAAWYAANTERKKAYSVDNSEARRINDQNREARKRRNGGILSRGLSQRLFKLQRGLCPCCKQPLGDSYHLDHIIPIDLGGPNVDSNMQLLRSVCNLQKHAKHPIDFMQERGFLL